MMLKVGVGVAAGQVAINEWEDAWPFKICDSGCCNTPELLKSGVIVYCISLALFIRELGRTLHGSTPCKFASKAFFTSVHQRAKPWK